MLTINSRIHLKSACGLLVALLFQLVASSTSSFRRMSAHFWYMLYRIKTKKFKPIHIQLENATHIHHCCYFYTVLTLMVKSIVYCLQNQFEQSAYHDVKLYSEILLFIFLYCSHTMVYASGPCCRKGDVTSYNSLQSALRCAPAFDWCTSPVNQKQTSRFVPRHRNAYR